MSRLVLIRHCQSSGQHPESPLTDAGAEAAEALAERLTALAPDAVYASPFVRAQATVRPFAARAGLVVRIDHRLQERRLSHQDLHDWQDHVRRSFTEPDYSAPGGESLRQTQARGLAALAGIADANHRLPIVASHGNLIAALLKSMEPAFGFEDWRALRNPDLFEVSLEAGRPVRFRRLSP